MANLEPAKAEEPWIIDWDNLPPENRITVSVEVFDELLARLDEPAKVSPELAALLASRAPWDRDIEPTKISDSDTTHAS